MSLPSRIIAFVLIHSISCQGFARTPSPCQELFSGTDKVEKNPIPDILQSHYDLRDSKNLLIRLLTWRAQKILQIDGYSSDAEIRRKVVKADEIMTVVKNVIHRNPLFERVDSYETEWVKRELLSQNIVSVFETYQKSHPEIEKWYAKIFKNRALHFLINSTKMPTVADEKLSIELMERILRDGAFAHEKEIAQEHQKSGQNRVDAYRRFALVYTLIAMIIVIYLLKLIKADVDENINQARVDAFTSSLNGVNDIFEALDEEFAKRGLYEP